MGDRRALVERALQALRSTSRPERVASPWGDGPVVAEVYSFAFEARARDPFWQAAMAALRRIASQPHLPAVMRWLEEADPGRHCWLTATLPAQFERPWGRNLEGLKGLLNEWVEAHRRASEDYKAARETQG